MAKTQVIDGRSDFRGGRNTSVSPDLLNPSELQDCTNARLSNDQIGAIMKRTGNQRLHVTALPTPIVGITQWDAPSGKQTVVIAGDGNLYYKSNTFVGDFTMVTGTFSIAAGFVDFADFRGSASGAPLWLFIADGQNLYTWDGVSVITLLTGTNGAPAAVCVRQCQTRLFAVDYHYLKQLNWSRMGDGTYWLVGLSTDGGASLIDTFNGNAIVRVECVVDTMLIFTNKSVSSFTGTDFSNITISTDTGGVSTQAGISGPFASDKVEQIVAMFSDLGPYFVSQSGIQAFGVDVESDFASMNRALIANIAIGYHRGRREVWIAYSEVGDAYPNMNVLVFNTRFQNWMGPFVYPFGIVAFTQFVDSGGDEWLQAACSDGFVRHMDIGAKDDVLANNAGGSIYTMSVILSPIFFPPGPGVAKAGARLNIQANLPSDTLLNVSTSFDGRAYVNWTAAFPGGAIAGLGDFSNNYRVDMDDVGHRLTIKFTDASADIPIINGIITQGYNYMRPE